MAEFLTGMKRTVKCGDVTVDMVGQEVTVMGWTNRRRNLGSLVFFQIRDISGIVQAVIDSNKVSAELFEKAEQVKLEYVIAVRGVVAKRTGPNVNPNMKTGEIEIEVTELRILSEAEVTPFNVGDRNAGEALRLKYRYLDLRREDLQRNLIVRSKNAQTTRRYLSDNGFLEIETPFLGKSTPEGARDYLVPSRVHPGKFYALPQSPQIFKQLLMVGGIEKYYQIAKCFRDEDLRADRQPEFTQVDMEMSFVNQDDVIKMTEGLIENAFKAAGVEVKAPFRRITYKEAMEKYGSDKPDTRFGLELFDVSDIMEASTFEAFKSVVAAGGTVRAIKIPGIANYSRKDMDDVRNLAISFGAKGLAWVTYLETGEVKSPVF